MFSTQLRVISRLQHWQCELKYNKFFRDALNIGNRHCHDTYGTAIANILHLARLGMTTFDSSIAGLGGCPFAPGASGNVGTEDLIYALEMEGYHTGLLFNLDRKADRRLSIVEQLAPIAETGQWISEQLGRQSASKVGRAILARAARA
jgi:hydroxymethylglutaryl-CoA lyase